MANLEGPRYLKDSPKLAEQLRQLQNEKKILRAVVQDYQAVERSKFARLRSAWCSLLELFTEGSARIAMPSPPEEPDAVPGLSEAPPPGAQTESAPVPRVGDDDDRYERWMTVHNPSEADFEAMRAAIGRFDRRPLISIIMPVYNTPERYLRAAIVSVRNQIYPHWELCIADDNSSSREHREILAEYAAIDARIKVVYRTDNGHISHASNSALELATGKFVGFLDHDDVLAREALDQVASVISIATPMPTWCTRTRTRSMIMVTAASRSSSRIGAPTLSCHACTHVTLACIGATSSKPSDAFVPGLKEAKITTSFCA